MVVVFVGGKDLVSIGGGAVASHCMSTLFKQKVIKKENTERKWSVAETRRGRKVYDRSHL
jgi:NADPH-dependent glutamate synthase beta subunit-like oxidoreductase